MSKPRVRQDNVIRDVRKRNERAPKGNVRKVVTIFFGDLVNERTCQTVKRKLYRQPSVKHTWIQGGNAVGMKITAPADKIDKLVKKMVQIARNLATSYAKSTAPNKQPAHSRARVRRSERRGPAHRVDWSSNRLAAP